MRSLSYNNNINSNCFNTLNDLSCRRNTSRRTHDLLYLPSIDDLAYTESGEDSLNSGNSFVNETKDRKIKSSAS